jgi:hypothetical protein
MSQLNVRWKYVHRAKVQTSYLLDDSPLLLFVDLHRPALGASQKCCSIQRTRMLLPRGHNIGSRTIKHWNCQRVGQAYRQAILLRLAEVEIIFELLS